MGNILILANNDVGLYKFRKELIIELLKSNSVFISVPNGEYIKLLTDMGCIFINTEIDRRGINPMKDLKLIKNYRKMIDTLKLDIIITYTIKPNIYGNLISRKKGITSFANITGVGTAFQKNNLLRKVVIHLYKKALLSATVVFFENIKNKNDFLNMRIINEEQACILNGAGVNLDEYSFQEYPKKHLNINFLFISRIMKEKGIDEFLYSANKLKNEFPAIVFNIVGYMESDYTKALSNSAVTYHGYQKDVIKYISKAHCVVLPSYHEGMANTNLEAASIGRPLITSDIYGCRESIIDQRTGFLCKSKDKEDLYIKMKQFVELSYEEKKLMGIRGRLHMEKVFNKKNVVENTLKKMSLK